MLQHPEQTLTILHKVKELGGDVRFQNGVSSTTHQVTEEKERIVKEEAQHARDESKRFLEVDYYCTLFLNKILSN